MSTYVAEIEKLLEGFRRRCLRPFIAAEIEFYVILEHSEVIDILQPILKGDNPGIDEIKHEDGNGQYEFSTNPTFDVTAFCEQIIHTKKQIAGLLQPYNLKTKFSPKPYSEQPSNSMHIHVNLFDLDGNNMFGRDRGCENQLILHAIAGLLHFMQKDLRIFSPDKIRFSNPDINTPQTISWGANNRTTAIRIPDCYNDPHKYRIEHRVSAADSDPYAVIYEILKAMLYGIDHQMLPETDKIHGNASDKQYKLNPYNLKNLL
jgi:glutamine synthetase